MIFVDTSALIALVSATDAAHGQAVSRFRELREARELHCTTRYVEVETISLAQRRLGMRAVRDAFAILRACKVEAVSPLQHERAVEMLLSQDQRRLSLVDCSSFIYMRDRGIRRAFAYDRHFAEHGFETA